MSARSRVGPAQGWLLVGVLNLAMGIGVAVGLVVSWWLWPVEYMDVSPDTLHPQHRAEYIVLISHAYAHDQDLRRAQVRLAALGEVGSVGVEVVTLAEQYAAQGRDLEDTQSLARLAHVLGHRRAALAPFMPGGEPTATWTPWPTATATATPTETAVPTLTSTATAVPTATPTATRRGTETVQPPSTSTAEVTPTVTPRPSQTLEPTRTRPATRTPRPTLTPTVTATPEPRFELSRQQRLCTGDTEGLLKITVLDAEGEPLPSVELLIRWQSGEDRFYTGLKPEKGAGYADYELTPGESYQVGIVGPESDVAQEITADACADGRRASWELVFRFQGSAP